MGGVVAKGETNDELVENLIEGNCIKKLENIRVFKAVDRGHFFPGEYIDDAYRDMAMRTGNLHMSAPCIYCCMLENLELEAGMSFLNIGSGTGYLSTLIGLLIGPNGTNHGIEIFQDVIDYANTKIDEFIRYSDGFTFCNFQRPTFIQGNMHCLAEDSHQYDRVYCGARVDYKTKDRLQKLVKTNGVLIIPYQGHLMKYKKMTEAEWEESLLLDAHFSELVKKRADDKQPIRIYSQPQRLQELSRISILQNVLKNNNNTVKELDQLPIPRILIKYLKYYRDENQPIPETKKKRRRVESVDGGDGEDGGLEIDIGFRVVIR